MIGPALGQLRLRPAAFAGVATALVTAVGALTLFGTLAAARQAAPPGTGRAETGPGLLVIAAAFGEIAVLVAFFVLVNALGYAVRQQHRELTLLRTVAATPRQIRALVRRQTVLLTAVAAPAGWAAGTAGARWFLGELTARRMAPAGLHARLTLPVAAGSALLALLVALAATALAARRITRTAPAAALAESTTGTADRGSRAGLARTALGLIVLAGGGVLCTVIARQPAEKAGQATLLVTLLLLAGLALCGPALARALAALLGPPARLAAPRAGWLAAANLRGHAHRLSAAVVPITLLTGFSGTMLLMTRTVEHHLQGRAAAAGLATVTSPGDVWLRQAETGLLAGFTAVATVNTLAALTADRRREFALLALVGATRRQIARMLTVEALLTTAIGVLLGAAVAWTATAAFAHALTGTAAPAVPWAGFGRIAATALLLTAPGILLAGLRATAGPAVDRLTGGRRD
ncbi:ABC transporter permease [Kitasatospora camelliae]|uniref:ABC transporter permease n=1 Tax=Kitasatospora camelliae TaxID=3156397 RepID=A0AAU8K5G8_9ACTN